MHREMALENNVLLPISERLLQDILIICFTSYKTIDLEL